MSWLKHLCLIEKPMHAPVTEREGDSDQTSGSVMSKPEAAGAPAGTPRWPSPYEPPAAKQKKTWPLIAAVWIRDAPQAVMTLFALFSVVMTAKNKVDIWPTAPKGHNVNYYKIWKCWKKNEQLAKIWDVRWLLQIVERSREPLLKSELLMCSLWANGRMVASGFRCSWLQF